MRHFVVALVLVASGLFAAHAQTTDQLLDTLQHTAFNYFWYEANSANGLIKDRSTPGSPSSIAAVGFGLTTICIGIDHGWVTREAARDRVLTTLRTFWEKPQGDAAQGIIGYKGLFYHFLEMSTATRTWDCELSTIDTGLLLAGIVYVRQYFDTNDSLDVRVRSLADSIYYRMDWDWMRNSAPGILMGWKPNTQFSYFGQWIGYNEAMIMYILALGSPTHPVPPSAWSVWTSGYSWQGQYGYTYINFSPLFGHQYSHCWIDFRGIADDYNRVRGVTYFENSRRATYAQRAYCIANPGRFVGYSDSLWGLTAGDGPNGYTARGAPPALNDDGTISPTAAGASIPFAPEICIPALRNMYNAYRARLWMQYGFRDAFNLNVNWWGPDVLGIDQGPIAIMIENYRTQGVWNRFMKNPDIQRGLQRANFAPIANVANESKGTVKTFMLYQNYPNPFNGSTTIRYAVAGHSDVRIKVFDMLGRDVATLVNGPHSPGLHSVSFDAGAFPSGVYYYKLESHEVSLAKKLILLK